MGCYRVLALRCLFVVLVCFLFLLVVFWGVFFTGSATYPASIGIILNIRPFINPSSAGRKVRRSTDILSYNKL